MAKTIVKVSDEELQLLKKFNEDKRKALLVQLAEVDDTLEQYDNNVKGKTQVKLPFESGFAADSKRVDKILFVISDLNRFATIREITIRFSELDPSVNVDGKPSRTFYKALTRAVLHLCKERGPLAKKEGGKVLAFGKKEWLNPDGTIKEAYK